MEFEKRPKCWGCGNHGEDTLYIFQPHRRGKGGYLWHASCYVKVEKQVHESFSNIRTTEEGSSK